MYADMSVSIYVAAFNSEFFIFEDDSTSLHSFLRFEMLSNRQKTIRETECK